MADALPEIRTRVPGPRSVELAERLYAVECPAITSRAGPLVFWERGAGANLFDVDGNRFVDLLAGFGTACLGHAHPELAKVAGSQAAQLVQALGDVYPARLKVELLEALERLLPGDLGAAILSSSGSDAVESALKTALRATGRADVLAFEGAYHGLSLGALDATERRHFRAPFQARLPGRTVFVPFGDAAAVDAALGAGEFGAILVEPIQGRGGIRVAPPGFLAELRALADRHGVLLVADEVYTGLGRTGHWLACEHEGVLPDLVALGKALGGGFPISVCAGRPELMARWGQNQGEAIHTSTHLGNPLACAVALRVLDLLQAESLPARAARLGERLLARLERDLSRCPDVVAVRGRGLMIGIELCSGERAGRAIREALATGWILLGEGADGNVLALTPPLTIAEELLDGAADRLVELLSP
jgi:4-aminobutyrate aminotransferase/(S)-3-amino-2-methylpropionate transaminase